MDTQTDVYLPRSQMALRNMNSGNIFYMPLTSFAGKQSSEQACIYLRLIAIKLYKRLGSDFYRLNWQFIKLVDSLVNLIMYSSSLISNFPFHMSNNKELYAVNTIC